MTSSATATFDEISSRLNYLEKWREIAIRPCSDECHDDDKEFLEKETDNLIDLSRRCLEVREDMNSVLPPHMLALDEDLVVRKSAIANAGDGLYYEPAKEAVIKRERVICYYTGHRHNFLSQKYLKDRSYLLNVGEDLFVDPGPSLHIKARYINDPLNEEAVNCKYVPELSMFRCAVVVTRDIFPGEELFVSYGSIYWSQQKFSGTVHHTDKNDFKIR